MGNALKFTHSGHVKVHVGPGDVHGEHHSGTGLCGRATADAGVMCGRCVVDAGVMCGRCVVDVW
jgi:hypothetical protein